MVLSFGDNKSISSERTMESDFRAVYLQLLDCA